MENEIVYILSNPAMPGLVKIGKTTQADIQNRIDQLYNTSVPVPFKCEYAVVVEDCSKVEKALHEAFEPSRINPSREFFKMEAGQAKAILELLSVEDVTPSINQELEKGISDVEIESGKKLKRPNLNFEEMNIPKGAKLTYKTGTEEIIVENDKKVNYDGEIMSLTAATKKILDVDYSVQPTPYWKYNGRSLAEIYNETYIIAEE